MRIIALALLAIALVAAPISAEDAGSLVSNLVEAVVGPAPLPESAESGVFRPMKSCGTERWSVKTGTDPDASKVNLGTPKKTTIVTTTSWTPPDPLPLDSRYAPYETTVWKISTTLVRFKLEADSDYHLVIQDADGNTQIIEIPDPKCVGSSSPFLDGVTNARNQMDAQYSVTSKMKTVNVPVVVTGVGFFDFLHGQSGVAPNGFELHPVLDLQFSSAGVNSTDF